MKKFISVCIAAAMLAALFCMSVFAADLPHVVGTHGVNGTLADGAETPDGQGSADVTLAFGTNKIQHRYAVDVTFTNTALTVDSLELTWNVNDHKYDGDNSEAKEITTTIDIENHSDLAVKYEVGTSATTETVVTNNLTVTSDTTNAASSTVAAAAITTGDTVTDPGKSTGVSVKFTVEPQTGKTWGTYAQALAGDTAAKTIGSITVTIAAAS